MTAKLIVAVAAFCTVESLAPLQGQNNPAQLIEHPCDESPKTADDVFEFRVRKSAGYKSYSAYVTHTMRTSLRALSWHERRYWKAPHLIRSETEGEQAVESKLDVIGTDGIAWQVRLMQGRMSAIKRLPVTGETNSLTHVPLLDHIGYEWNKAKATFEYALLPAQDFDGQKMYVIEGGYKESAVHNRPSFEAYPKTRTRLYIGQQDGFIHKIDCFGDKMAVLLKYNPSEPYTSAEWKEVQLNVELPDELFVYQPPPDMPVIVHTAKVNSKVDDPSPPTTP